MTRNPPMSPGVTLSLLVVVSFALGVVTMDLAYERHARGQVCVPVQVDTAADQRSYRGEERP